MLIIEIQTQAQSCSTTGAGGTAGATCAGSTIHRGLQQLAVSSRLTKFLNRFADAIERSKLESES